MARLNGTLTFVDKNGDDKSIVRVIDNLTEVNFGNHLSNDILIKSEDVEKHHCKIYFNEIQRIIITNYSKSHPILVNNQAVEGSKELKSGDVITILENSMRWETKDDAKRRISFLSKEERKAMKRKYIKTNKRITIHSVSVQNMVNTSPEEASSSSNSAEKSSIPETLESTPETVEENNSPVKEQQAVPTDKENEKTPVKVNKLNMSGTLLTSYTPPTAGKMTRSVSKTPFNSPLRTPLVKSAVKNILNDSLNTSKFDSPKSAQKLNNSQMHLIDLTTPFTKRTESTSTPKTSSIRKTPRTIGKTPVRNATLLKSAIKNSSIQKNFIQQNVANIAAKGKQLFESPAKRNITIKEDEASLIEISMSSVSEIDSSKASINDNSNCEVQVQKVEEENGKITQDEVKDLLQSIDAVLDGDKSTQPVSEPEVELTTTKTVEENFNMIVDNQSSIGTVNESLFDKALNNVPIEDINNFDKLLTDEGTSSTDDTEKKGEIVLKLIEKARESLSTPNKTTQVLSARYSNITNDSLTESVNTSQKYDATTPKISLLETVISGRKSDLTMGPVSRLSLTKDETEIVENYQLNSNNSESLRSTRKRMRTAMSSIGILNASQLADTTLNESLQPNSVTDNDQVDFNQSQPEETNILSLDNQPDMNTSNKENEFSGALNMSMKFIEYSEVDENNQESKKIFELSNDGDDLIDSDNESESDDEDEEEILNEDLLNDPNDDLLDEPIDDKILDEDNDTKEVESNNVSTKKCRISQADLETLGEEGIDILEQSKDEEQLEEMLEELDTEIKEVPSNEKLEEITENNEIKDFEAVPEEVADSNGFNDTFEIPATQQIELEEEIAEKEVPMDDSEYLDDIPETQQLDFGVEEALETNSTFDGTIEALDSTKEGDLSIEPQEVIKQEELIVNNDDILDETVEDQLLNETNGQETNEIVENKQIDDTVVSDKLDETVEDSFNEHVEIPATQAFEFEESFVEERLDDTNDDNAVNIKEEISVVKFESRSTVFSVNDSTIISSQEPVNKSDTADSISVQEISDSSEICSQESNVARLGSSIHVDDLISENDSNEIVNKADEDEACINQESKNRLPSSLNSNVSETINELISTPTDILTSIAVQEFSTTEIDTDHVDIPATQDVIDDTIEEEKTVEGDSAIGTTTSKIDQTNDSEKRVDESINENPIQSRESALFSDTEFSHVDINASAFLKETDSDEFAEIKNNQELTEIETNQAQTDELEEDKLEKQKESIEKELENVDFGKKINKKGKSILPSEISKAAGSRNTMIPDLINDSFAALIEDKHNELKESEVVEQESVQDEIGTKNDTNTDIDDEKMDDIEKQLAEMNAEPIVDFNKERSKSMLPQFEDNDENSDKTSSSRLTIIPTEDRRRPSFLIVLEEEKASKLEQNQPLEVLEDKPFVSDNDDTQKIDELSSENQEEEENNKEPVVEEPCIKKQAYVTTENEKEVKAPETPSRRRVARVNYSELATGSPARSRRGRSASTESNGDKDKEPKSAIKRKEKGIKMEPIVEDDISVQITVTATENNQQKVETSEDVPMSEEMSEVTSEMPEKESENMAIEENTEQPIDDISEPALDKELLQEEQLASNQDNQFILEDITEDSQDKSNESETLVEHPENLQLMEVPKPESMQIMAVPAPENLQLMEVPPPEKLQVMEVAKPREEHSKDPIVQDITSNAELQQQQDEILESNVEDVINEAENVETEHPIEEQIENIPEKEAESNEVVNDEIIESSEEPIQEISDEIIEISERESVESVQQETVQKEVIEPEKTQEVEVPVQNVEEQVPSESVSHKEEDAQKSKVDEVPQTPSRKRAKKLNYLELASGSPARTPRSRGRLASTEEKQEKSSKPELPPTIPEEVSDKSKEDEIVSSTSEELVTKEVTEEKPQEVKKKPGRARKIDQLKPNNEDVPTPSKRSRRGVTPVQPQSSTIEPEKKSRKRQPKAVDPEPEKESEESVSEVQPDKQVIVLSSTESEEAVKPVAKKGRGKQLKVVEEVPKEVEHVEEPQQAKKGRGRKAKIDETPVVEEKLPEKVEASPKRGRGRKVVEESHEEKSTEIEKVTETTVAKKSRKRQAEPEKSKDTEDINKDEPATVPVESPQPAKKRNRAVKATEEIEEHKEPEKTTVAPKRGRKGKNEAVPEVQESQKEEIAPKSAGRKGKQEEAVEIHKDPEPVVHEVPKKGRGRKKVDEAPKETEIEPEKVEEPVPKRAGRKGKNEVAENSVPETPTEESVPKRAGRKGKIAEIQQNNPVQETPKRGRKVTKAAEATEVIQKEPEEPKQMEEVAPKRGGKKAKTEVVAESHEEPTVAVAQELPKKGRGRKNVVEEVPKVEEPQSSSVQQEEISAAPIKKGRGRQAKVIETKTDEPTEVEKEAPKRGRAQKHKEVTPDPVTDQPVTKKPRGRQAKQPEVATNEPETQSPKQTTAKTPVKRKAGSKHVTIVTPSTMQAHHSKETTKSEEPVVTKRATKRQATQPTIEEEPPVAAKRSTRAKK